MRLRKEEEENLVEGGKKEQDGRRQ